MDKIRVKDLPFFLIAYFGIISPYFLALYLFDKTEFLNLTVLSNILLDIAYSFPVLYLTIIPFVLIFILSDNDELFENIEQFYLLFFQLICWTLAVELYLILIIFIMFFPNESFLTFRNATWIITFIMFLIFLTIILYTYFSDKVEFKKNIIIKLFTKDNIIGETGNKDDNKKDPTEENKNSA